MRFLWHDDAVGDLDEIRAYIAQDNPSAATQVVGRIRSGTEMLMAHPLMGRLGRVPETREFVFSDIPYIAIYRVNKDSQTIEVLQVVHTSRLYPPKNAK
jgi:toxin ParE1/3/4